MLASVETIHKIQYSTPAGTKYRTRRPHERKRATATRPVLECLAQRACARLYLPSERHQAAGSDRIIRSIRRTAEEHGYADGLQARRLHRGPRTCRQSFSRSFFRQLIGRKPAAALRVARHAYCGGAGPHTRLLISGSPPSKLACSNALWAA